MNFIFDKDVLDFYNKYGSLRYNGIGVDYEMDKADASRESLIAFEDALFHLKTTLYQDLDRIATYRPLSKKMKKQLYDKLERIRSDRDKLNTLIADYQQKILDLDKNS